MNAKFESNSRYVLVAGPERFELSTLSFPPNLVAG